MKEMEIHASDFGLPENEIEVQYAQYSPSIILNGQGWQIYTTTAYAYSTISTPINTYY
jgi:hypothetical protein